MVPKRVTLSDGAVARLSDFMEREKLDNPSEAVIVMFERLSHGGPAPAIQAQPRPSGPTKDLSAFI